ncbi:hypothetical protein LTR78_010222 [Recurvomyces mirabilis]|uniref:Uncharacterized protein n=1 Tax=Recurvomyces mirabilis TaxID=574656 RepID=A0AAE0TQ37_9PEZI|nr:hypothetical protein LTR78_010222 [Recurvomyces mirabilis]KAK5149688.1 hypothetical protein LTS14_010749 [Recurvomyces mirabilis]
MGPQRDSEKPHKVTAYRELGQGIRTFHEDPYAEVDILAVPGLGANPEECWTWNALSSGKQARQTKSNVVPDPADGNNARQSFNWIRDESGLRSLFPKSRILLCDYASAWRGRFKVRATMKSICTALLDDLVEKRKDGAKSTRPLIIIGHSMGRVVVAKYEAIATCTMGCLFFEVPFRGTEMARIALMYSSVFGSDAYEALLTFMKAEKNDVLEEVREDFVEFCNKLIPAIEVYCFWEQVSSDVAYSTDIAQKLGKLGQHKYFATGARAVTNVTLRKLGAGTHVVSKESAEIDGAHSVSLAATHRDLIRFESVTSENVGAGFGKTNASLAAIQQISKSNSSEVQATLDRGSRGDFLGFFLCERPPGFCTAEDDLKSLITQLVNQEESLAQHGKWFVSSQRYRNATSASETFMILTQDEEIRLKIEQLLQVMTIVYEPPTLCELSVLMAVEDLHELAALVKRCSPVLRFADTSAEKDKVAFGHTAFRERLFVEADGHEGSMSPRIREYHGRMALLCFEYIQTRYGSSDLEEGPEAAPHRRPAMTTRATDDASVLVVTNEDDEFDDGDEGSLLTSSHACSYPIKYLIRHLGEGSPDAAQTLCEDDPDFWGFRSSLRDTWLTDFRTLTTDLKDIDTSGMSALHIAAGIGANELVSMLVDRNGATALAWTNPQGLTALHVAALNDRASVVEALIRAGADIEAGDGSAGTPLHMAALHGRVHTVGMLIARGANINAFGHDVGPVINAAILSGCFETVKHVMSADVHFVVDCVTCPPPLSLSAGRSEPSLFRDILETGKEKWLQNGKLLDQAIIAASAGGPLESIRILLKFAHAYTSTMLQTAILSAAVENKWVVTRELLGYVINDNVNGAWRETELEDTFYLAAVSREEQLDVLGQIWHLTQHDTSQGTKDYAAYQATALRKTRTVTWLLEVCSASPNASSSRPSTIVSQKSSSISGRNYITILNAAAGSGNLILAENLIRRGAKMDGASNYALQLAARSGYIDVVNMLLDHYAAIDRKVPDSDDLNFSSGTALQAACEYGRLEVVDTLLRRGADSNLSGRILSRPLVVVTQDAKLEILKLLLAAPGTEPNVHGGESQGTPLIFAAANMSVEAVRLLLQKGADINAKDNLGDTALIMAAWKGDRECVEHLCDQGADVTYRSPHRGLASQVAANEHHADCENVLAARMGDTIDYRNGAIHSQATLKKRDAEIETLMARLAEAHEERVLAKRGVEFHKHEKETLMSESDFHGEAYASMEHQLRDAQNERTALSNQVRAARGQANLANGSVVKLRALLTEQRETNDALRQRTGYTARLEEKTTALALVSELSTAASKQAEAAQIERSKLEEQVQMVLARCQQQDTDKDHADMNMKPLILELEVE